MKVYSQDPDFTIDLQAMEGKGIHPRRSSKVNVIQSQKKEFSRFGSTDELKNLSGESVQDLRKKRSIPPAPLSTRTSSVPAPTLSTKSLVPPGNSCQLIVAPMANNSPTRSSGLIPRAGVPPPPPPMVSAGVPPPPVMMSGPPPPPPKAGAGGPPRMPIH